MEALGQIMLNYDVDNSGKYISREFQDFGYRLALELNDKKNIPLYMRLAKTVDRAILESALSFVKDAKNVKSKSALFLWKMKDMRSKSKEVKKNKSL